MSDTSGEQDETGFAFTDEDYTRRYFPGEAAAAPPPANPVAPAAPAIKGAARLHGGGNSFMRARRRRLAASQTA